jgi:predicted phosphoadenosine phosphosulfate sulfurtransferase
MAKINKKQAVEQDVYSLALQRMRLCYDRFDKVVVAFSGGKDSTACMNLALQVAREKGRLPLDVYTFDEECIPPETVEYLDRVSEHPDVRFKWFCLPLKAGNACSREHPEWFMWYEPEREKWVRELPPKAITKLAGFKHGMALADCIPLIWGPEYGSVCNILGIRTQESMTRYSSIATKKGFDCFTIPTEAAWIWKAYPIYDWTTEDVWVFPAKFGFDYNRVYDTMRACGLPPLVARCSPTFGEQTNRRLWAYKVCWPELWAKMCDRVPGAATAGRYANTELYGIGIQEDDLPDGTTWQRATLDGLAALGGEAKADVAKAVAYAIRHHGSCYETAKRGQQPIPDAEPDPVSGYCWKYIYGLVKAGGDKFDRQSQKLRAKANATRKQTRLMLDE